MKKMLCFIFLLMMSTRVFLRALFILLLIVADVTVCADSLPESHDHWLCGTPMLMCNHPHAVPTAPQVPAAPAPDVPSGANRSILHASA